MKRDEFKQFIKEKKAEPGAEEAIKSSGTVNAWLMSM